MLFDELLEFFVNKKSTMITVLQFDILNFILDSKKGILDSIDLKKGFQLFSLWQLIFEFNKINILKKQRNKAKGSAGQAANKIF